MGLQSKLFFLFAILLLAVIGFRYLFIDHFLQKDLLAVDTEIQGYIAAGEISKKAGAFFSDLLNDFASNLLSQTSFISFGFLILALFIVWLLIRSIIRPLTKLCEESEKISEGKYEEVSLPALGNRKDEIAVLTKSYAHMVEGLIEREKIRSVLNKVVSKDVADEILKSTIHLGGEDRIVTILFCDIRNFTEMSEHLTPQQTIELLNIYMTKMTRIAEGEGGVIDKYIGDEIMVLYGVPVHYEDHAIRALATAKIMMESLKKWNEKRVANGEVPIEAGVGIHSGLVVAGNMGAEDRLNYTVLGAGVNLAARLCKAAHPMQILISEYTLKQPFIQDSFFVEKLDPITVKGFSEPVNIYTIAGFKWE